MHDLYIWGLSLTLVGVCLLAVVFVTAYYRKLFVDGETEEVEAAVKNIRHIKNRHYDVMEMVVPSVEYCYEGKVIKAHHYIQVPMKNINFHKGDIITIEINPRRQKVFRIRSAEWFSLEERKNRNSIFFTVGGACTLLPGIIMLTVTLLS